MSAALGCRGVPLPFVAIDVSVPNSAPAGAVAALLQACDEAFSRGGCELTSAGVDDPFAKRLVRIQWTDSTQLAVHVELGNSGQLEPQRVRDLAFLPGDSVVERWRSVGLVVGTLADESLLLESGSKPAVLAPKPPLRPTQIASSPPAPRTNPHRMHQATWLDGAFATGPALSRWQVGAALRGGHALGGPLFTLVGVRYSVLPRDADGVELRWITTSIGLGLRNWPVHGWLEVDFRAELLGGLTQATVSDSTTGNVDAAGRWAPGVRMGADAGLRLADWDQILVGGDIAYTGHPIEVRLHSHDVGTISPTNGMLLLGFRHIFR